MNYLVRICLGALRSPLFFSFLYPSSPLHSPSLLSSPLSIPPLLSFLHPSSPFSSPPLLQHFPPFNFPLIYDPPPFPPSVPPLPFPSLPFPSFALLSAKRLFFSTVPAPIAPGTFLQGVAGSAGKSFEKPILSSEAAAKKSLYILILSVSSSLFPTRGEKRKGRRREKKAQPQSTRRHPKEACESF